MTGAEFKKIVEYFGESNIISIGFDNSASITFPRVGDFSLANNYIEEIECLMFHGFDVKARPYHTVKHVENIQSIIVADGGVSRESYDWTSVRG